MNHWFRGTSLCIALLVGMLGLSVSLASVACAQDAAPAATETADAAGAGDSAEAGRCRSSGRRSSRCASRHCRRNNFRACKRDLVALRSAVILMQAGFALVEVGLNSAKNTVNILAKNLLDFGLGVILFFGVGYGLMYPGADYAGKYFGFDSSRLFAIPDLGRSIQPAATDRLSVPSSVRCYRCDDCFRCCCWPNEVWVLT